MSAGPTTRWVVALESEAAPIRERYGLTETIHGGPFVVYHHPEGSHWLVVSGIGVALSAGATAFLAERSAAPPWAIWLNVGIAGHGVAEVGRVHLAHTIVDRAADRTTFATLAFKSPLEGSALHTVHRPETDYPAPVLYDMEGAGFYAVARRLASAELVQCVKVVSDNPDAPVMRFSKSRISGWINAGLDQVDRVRAALLPLAEVERLRLTPSPHYAAVTHAFRFTATQSRQLADVLRRLHALGIADDVIEEGMPKAANARALLRGLNEAADAAAPNWAGP